MYSSFALIFLALAFGFYMKKTRKKIKTLESQRFVAINTCSLLINRSDNKKELLEMLGMYFLTTKEGNKNPLLKKDLLEANPGLTWDESVENAFIVYSVLSRFDDKENPLKNGSL